VSRRAASCRGRLVGAILLIPILFVVGWVGIRAMLAQAHVQAARALLSSLAAEIEAGQSPSPSAMAAALHTVGRQTGAARRLTSDPVWAFAAHLPAVGCTVEETTSLVAALDEAATTDLSPVVNVVGAMRPETVWSGSEVHLDVLARAGEPLQRTRERLGALREKLAREPGCGVMGRVSGLASARARLIAGTGVLLTTARDAEMMAQLAPTMLGGDGPRRYLLIVDNDAESRATGGVIGGLGVLTASRGRLVLEQISGNDSLPGGDAQKRPAMAVPAALRGRYGEFEPTTIWGNANLLPDYPTVSRFYTAMYKAGTGVTVDGVITVDPTTLAYLVAATRPALLDDGRNITADEFVALVESQVYAQISEPAKRDAFFAGTGRAAYQAVVSGKGSSYAFLRALVRAAAEGRFLIASNHPAEERALASLQVGGAVPRALGPYLAVVTQNAGATKLDYWMQRATAYRLTRRPDGTADAVITVRLRNTAPPGLPAYVRSRSDLGAPAGNPREQDLLWVSVYAGVRSGLVSATLDGAPIAMDRDVENAHLVASTYVAVDARQTRTLILHVWEPVWKPILQMRPQPMTRAERLDVSGIRVTRSAISPIGEPAGVH
jgi:hypothetical protein